MHELIHYAHSNGNPRPVQDCKIFKALGEKKKIYVDDEVLWKADGSCFPAEYWSYPQTANGEVVGAVVTFNDITERKQAAEIIRTSQLRYRALMEQSFDALLLIEIETQEVVEVNRRFTELFGYSLPEDAPLYVNRFVVDSQANLDHVYNKTLRQKRYLPPAPRLIRHKKGTMLFVERAGTVISIEGRDIFLASMRDMTKERRRQAELSRDVEFASRVQRDLLILPPESPLVRIRALYHPANFVSGDSFHLEWLNDGQLLRGFLIDVSGHGLATAIQTTAINVLLREAAAAKLPLLEQLLQVNSHAAKYFTDGAYAAILGFELDLFHKELRYVGAGITQFQACGRKINAPGMFVGMWEKAEFTEGVLPVASGDTFHFLTDGFTDAFSQPGKAVLLSPDGKDFDADVAVLEKLAKSGVLRDDATGVCIQVR